MLQTRWQQKFRDFRILDLKKNIIVKFLKKQDEIVEEWRSLKK